MKTVLCRMVLMEESQSKTYDSVLYSKRLHRELDAHIKLAIILACFCSQRCNVISSSFPFCRCWCNTCWWNFRCTKASDTLKMPFCCDKIQEASLFFSCKASEATPMLPYLCAILLHFSLQNWSTHCSPCIKAKSLTFHPSPYCILVLKCRDLLLMTSN